MGRAAGGLRGLAVKACGGTSTRRHGPLRSPDVTNPPPPTPQRGPAKTYRVLGRDLTGATLVLLAAASVVLCFCGLAGLGFLLGPPKEPVAAGPATDPNTVASVAVAPEPTMTVPTTAAPPTPTTAAPIVPAGCTAALPEDVKAISAGLEPGHTLGEAFVAVAGRRRWVNANIYEDRRALRASSADVWIIEPGGAIYSLSGSARDMSTFPDGRRLPDSPSAGDDIATWLQNDCVLPAAKARG